MHCREKSYKEKERRQWLPDMQHRGHYRISTNNGIDTIEVDCGCFGLLADMLKIPDMADMKAVIRNMLFIGMSLYIFKTQKTLFSLENYLKKV